MLAKLMTVKVSISLSVMNDKHGSNPKINMFKKECRREQDEDNLEKKRSIDINIVCDIIPREWDKLNQQI